MMNDRSDAALIRYNDKIQSKLGKLNKLAVTLVGDGEQMKTVDERASHA